VKLEFFSVPRVVLERGALRSLEKEARSFGQKAFLVSGARLEASQKIVSLLEKGGVEPIVYQVSGEPTIASVERALHLAKTSGCDWVLAVGGGSVLDTGKAVAALMTHPGVPLDYLEGIGGGLQANGKAAPLVAVPTTAGTGAEATRNAVLASPEKQRKASMRGQALIPQMAILDAELTLGLPPNITASTGMDALTQLIESFVSKKANPMTDALCRQGITMAAKALPAAYENGSNIDAREEMLFAAFLSGVTLANAGLGAVHGLAAVIGGCVAGAAHGAVCASLLASLMRANISNAARTGHEKTLSRYEEMARLLTGCPTARAADGVAWVEELTIALRAPKISQQGVALNDYQAIAAAATTSSSTKNNPCELSADELLEALQKS